MKRNFALVLAILFTIFTLPVNGLTVMAAEELNPDDLQDGIYEVNYKVDYEGADFSSYFTQPATIKVKNSKKYLEFEYTDTDQILDITRKGKVDTISEDKDANIKIVGFDIDSDLSKSVDMGLKMFYGQTHDVNLNFELDSLKVIELAEEEPVVKIETETDKKSIKFDTVEKNDSSLEKGKTKVKQKGEKGEKEITYEVTYTDGDETDRKVKDETTTKEPINKIVLKGTKESKPDVEIKTETDKKSIKFETVEKNDSSLEKGKTKVKQKGEKGEKEVTYEVTYTDGDKTDRKVKDETTTKEPINKIILKGTKESDSNEELDPDDLKEGTYEINYKVYNEDVDVDGYFVKPALLTVKKGEVLVQMEHTSTNFIEELIVPSSDVKIVEEDEEENSRIVEFKLDKDLSKTTAMKTSMVYGMAHDVELTFDTDSLKVIELAEEEPVVEVKDETKTEKIKFETVEKHDSSLDKGQEKVKQEGKIGKKEVTYEVTYNDGKETDRKPKGKEKIIEKSINEIKLIGTKEKEKEKGKDKEVADGTYDIKAKAMHATKNEASGAAMFINEDAQLSIKKGEVELTIAVPNDPMATIEGIQVEGVKAKVNKKGDITYHTFKLKELKTELNSQVKYAVPSLDMEHDVPFRFILEGLDELPLQAIIEDSTVETPRSDNDNVDIDNVVDKDDVDLKNQKTVESKLNPDNAYKIDYTIKHEDGIKDSVANDFFTNKGILLEKGNKTYVEMTITNGEMVKALKNKYGKAIVIKQNKDGSIVVQLRVNNDLSNMLLDMHIVVPKMPGFEGYNTKHKALLVFDKNSKQEIDVGNYTIAANGGSTGVGTGNGIGETGVNGNGNGAPDLVLGSSNNKTDEIVAGLKNTDIDKPEFGSNSNSKNTMNDKSKNPQTGDLTNIWLYAFLLAGSLLILGVKFRRRTI